jgi:magnesium chelatase family protein
MGFSFCRTIHTTGLQTQLITVEADIQQGLPRFTIVGLADTAVQEARERVRSAIKNQNLPFPKYAITINLAPSSDKKSGGNFDLSIALSTLAASHAIPEPPKNTGYFGELTLGGELRPVRNILLCAQAALSHGLEAIVVPLENGGEASLIENLTVYTATSLEEITLALCGRYSLPLAKKSLEEHTPSSTAALWPQVLGLARPKHALILSAITDQHTLLIGSPGCGKTTLAHAFPEILPDLSLKEAQSVAAIQSTILPAGSLHTLPTKRPWRAPHHSASAPSLIGGGSIPRPGEISLAHHGTLFLDEFAEFSTTCLEALREPMEEGVITISRAQGSLTFPAQARILAAMNPCPCGLLTEGQNNCSCSPHQKNTYRKKLSGPLLNRFGLNVRVNQETNSLPSPENTDDLKARINQARLNFPLIFGTSDFTSVGERYFSLLSKDNRYNRRDLRHIRQASLANALYEDRFLIEESDLLVALSFRPSGLHAV